MLLKIRYIISFLFFCTMLQGLFASDRLESYVYGDGDLFVIVEPSDKEISTSDFLTLKIYAEAASGHHIIFPDLSVLTELKESQIKNGYKAFSVFCDEESALMLKKDGKIMQTRTIILAPALPGKYLIAGFDMKSASISGKEQSVSVMPIVMKVVSVLPEDKKLLTLKPIVSLDDEKSSRNLWVCVGLCIIILSLFLAIKIKNKSRVALDRNKELIAEFQDLRSSQPVVIIRKLERLMIDYFSFKYNLSTNIASLDALIMILLDTQVIELAEKAKIIQLFDRYNNLRFSKELITSSNVDALCADFAEIIKPTSSP